MSALLATLVLLLATAVSLAVTPWLRRHAHRRGWVDEPDGGRKQHPFPVPRIGGVAVFAAFAVAAGALWFAPGLGRGTADALRASLVHVVIAGAMVLGVGLLDDIRGAKPLAKLAVQLTAALYLYAAGFRIGTVTNPMGGDPVDLGALSLPLTLLWLVGISNAFNLIDGLDGLAAGIALCATVTLFIAAGINGRMEVALLAAALGGALLGFLRYNFNPASIFLGDSGALFVGLTLAALAVRGNMKSSAAIAIAAPLLALAVPILDTLAAMARRLVLGRSVFQPDVDHIHHRLLRRGLTPARVVLLLYGAAAGFGALSLAAVSDRNRLAGLAVFAMSAVVWIGLQQVGYPTLARSLRLARNASASPVHAEGLRERLEAARDLEELWRRTTELARGLGFDRVELVASGWVVERLASMPAPAGFPVWRDAPAPKAVTATHAWRIGLSGDGVELGVLRLSGPLAAAPPGAVADALGRGVTAALLRALARPAGSVAGDTAEAVAPLR